MMRINKDKNDEIYKLLKEKGFKEDDRFFLYRRK